MAEELANVPAAPRPSAYVAPRGWTLRRGPDRYNDVLYNGSPFGFIYRTEGGFWRAWRLSVGVGPFPTALKAYADIRRRFGCPLSRAAS